MCTLSMLDPELLLREAASARGGAWPCGGMTIDKRRFDVDESDDAYDLRMDVPGAGPDDVDIAVRDDGSMHLVVKTAARTLVDRELALPADADPSSIEANCSYGVLQLKINKLAKPAPVAVAVSDAALPDEPSASTTTEPYELRKYVPGTAATDVTVTVEHNDTLKINAGQYRVAYALPDDADPTSVKASCIHGILTVRIPRVAPPLPHVVVVGAAIPEDRHVDLVHMQVPGFAPEHASVEVADGAVRISLKNDHAERRGAVSLPKNIKDYGFVRAAVAHGVLRVWADAGAVLAPATARIAVSGAAAAPARAA